MSLRIVNDGDFGMTFGTIANVFLIVFHGDLSIEGIAAMRRHERAFHEELGQKKFCIMSVLEVDEATVLASGREGREAATELAREMTPLTHGVAIVLDREGFIASVLRSMITMVDLVAKPQAMKTLDSVDAAIVWLEGRMGGERPAEWNRDEIRDAMKMLRARVLRPSGRSKVARRS
jgi:hypothetical protein